MLYQLLIRLDNEKLIKIGSLGNFNFPEGYFIYTGSAKRNFAYRIIRHIRKKKKYKWHIDYLLKHGRIIQIKKYKSQALSECNLNRITQKKYKGVDIIKGFGSSDCKCRSHLLFVGKKFNLIN